VLILALEEDAVLLLAPAVLGEVGVELVVPSLTALFAVAAVHLTRDERPLLRAVLRHERAQLLILARVPRPPVHGVPILVAALTGRAHTRGSDSREGTRGGDGAIPRWLF